jgi:acyl-CoA thioester hydrolase
MTDFAYVLDMPVRFRDLDPLDHVNNAVYATYLEQVRTDYLDDVLEGQVEDGDFVLANLEIDYLTPVHYEDDLSIAIRTSELGSSSLHCEYEVRANDAVAAMGETTQVHIDENGRPTRLPDAWREALERFEPGLDA